ncbi:hypothetical protein [Corynebacterium rouxii]|uniref:hypothetical protein n=1 Tax=Corynebacterium rouxii TaxID=2719119 RepID=UPI00313B9214
MNPTITDKDSGRELWRVEDCAKHCEINTNTWHSTYTSTGRAPSQSPNSKNECHFGAPKKSKHGTKTAQTPL